MRNQWGRAIDPMTCRSMLVNYARLYRLPHEQKEQLERDNHYGSGRGSYCFHRGSLQAFSDRICPGFHQGVETYDSPGAREASGPSSIREGVGAGAGSKTRAETGSSSFSQGASHRSQSYLRRRWRISLRRYRQSGMEQTPRRPVRHHSQSGRAEAGLHSMKTCSWAQFKRSTSNRLICRIASSMRCCANWCWMKKGMSYRINF